MQIIHTALMGIGWRSLFCAAWLSVVAMADEPIEFGPIRYQSAPSRDRIAALNGAMRRGEVALKHDARFGYLPAVLDALDVPRASQALVFSRTSVQVKYISPKTPRAIYFGDDVYVAWVQDGPLLELTATDPVKGAVFYTLSQTAADAPRFVRDDVNCLQCHSGAQTQGGPGLMVRSVYADEQGFVLIDADQLTTTHRTPIEKRWGGWYVTARRDAQPHLGNLILPEGANTSALKPGMSESRATLKDLVDTSQYLTPHSDIVSLMVLEHQTHMQSLITRAQYRAAIALDREADLEQMLGRPVEGLSRRTQREIQRVGDAVVRYLLFTDEAKLEGPIEGTDAQFIERFQRNAKRDAKGRSLRDLDLNTRLFKYPCSYMIHSPMMAALPVPMLDYIAGRLRDALTGNGFAHLNKQDRKAITEILDHTGPDWWRKAEHP